MKKGIKITLIALASLILLVLIAGSITIATVFSSNKLTKIINKEAPKFLTCKFHLDKADLTFFKTFPKVGIELHNLTLINPVYGAPTDTLLDVKSCVAAINIRELVKNQHLLVKNFTLNDGKVNLFTNPVGQNNYNIVVPTTKDTTSTFNYTVDLEKVTTKNISIKDIDLSSKFLADLRDLDLSIKGNYQSDNIDGKVQLKSEQCTFKTLDSNQLFLNTDGLSLQFKGALHQYDTLNGSLKLNINKADFHRAAEAYFDTLDIALNSYVEVELSTQHFQLQNALLKLGEYALTLSGEAKRDTASGDIALDMRYETETWPLKRVLAMIPQAVIGTALDGIDADGKIGLAGTVTGHINDESMPLITADVVWKEGTFAMENLPLTFHKIDTRFGINLDLDHQTDVNIKELSCYTGNNHITATGTIQDLLEKMLFDLNVTGDLNVADFKQFLPADITKCKATAHANVHAQFNREQLSNVAIDQMTANGKFQFHNLDLSYKDSLHVQSPDATVEIAFPVTDKPYKIGEWAHVKLDATTLTGDKIGLGKLAAKQTHVDAFVNNIMDSTIDLKVGAAYQFEFLAGVMDTIDVNLQNPSGKFMMKSSDDLALQLKSNALNAKVGNTLSTTTGDLDIAASTHYNEKATSTLLQWNPEANIHLNAATISMSSLDIPVVINNLKADLTTQQCNIQNAKGTFGNSDFTIGGKIVDLDKYLNQDGLLTGNLTLKSKYLDINQIMDVVSGLGVSDSVMAEAPESSQKDPFMVPFGMNIQLLTNIDKALYEDVEIRNIAGQVSLKDGILVLEEMGLTSDAARMQLTAMYKSPRKNHLFLGLDFHLLDIKIDKLIEMIPEVDTVLPMLKSFAGNAEFHFAIETYLKSNYDLKYSTLRGAAAINGKDLVVLDQDTYKKISKLLKFKKNTPNRIDSLSAEATIFKKEVDVYPFAVSIDRYQAVLSGRHNLDMTYNYNISLLKPIRLGLDIIGTDKRKFKVGKAKYATMFKPEKQNVVEQNVMTLKKQINDALKANVKEQPLPQQ